MIKSIQVTSVLLVLIFITGCGHPELPSAPKVKDHYAILIKGQILDVDFANSILNVTDLPEFRDEQITKCLHFNILSFIPYKIEFDKQVDLKECNLVGGYKPKDSLSIYNWFSDAEKALDKFKHCFKK